MNKTPKRRIRGHRCKASRIRRSQPTGSGHVPLETARTATRASNDPQLSAGGRFVVYSSAARDLVDPAPGPTFFPWEQIYRYDAVAGTTRLVTHQLGQSSAALQGSNLSGPVSADGRYLVLATGAVDFFVATLPPPIFSDGFESGSTAAWSQTIP